MGSVCGKLNKIVFSSLRPWGLGQAARPLCALSVDKRKTSFVELLRMWTEMINTVYLADGFNVTEFL